jgi:hypothetical protein
LIVEAIQLATIWKNISHAIVYGAAIVFAVVKINFALADGIGIIHDVAEIEGCLCM